MSNANINARPRAANVIALTLCVGCLLGVLTLVRYFFPGPQPGPLTSTPAAHPTGGSTAAENSPPALVKENQHSPAEAPERASAAPPTAVMPVPAEPPAVGERKARSPTVSPPAPAAAQASRARSATVSAKSPRRPTHKAAPPSATAAQGQGQGQGAPAAAPKPQPKALVGIPLQPRPSAASAEPLPAPGPPVAPAPAFSSVGKGGPKTGSVPGPIASVKPPSTAPLDSGAEAGIDTTPKGPALGGRGAEGAAGAGAPAPRPRTAVAGAPLSSLSVHKTLKQVWPSYIHPTRVNVPIPGHQWVARQVDSLKKKRFNRIVPQQFDYSCGAASLATLLTYYFGRITSEKEAMKGMIKFGDPEMIRRRGFSLLDMQKYANELGYRAGGYKVDLTQLKKIHLPLIVLITVGGRPHFVVLKGVRDGRAFLADPSIGNHVVPLHAFGRVWNGNIFALQGPKDSDAPGLPLIAARPPGPDDQVATMGLGFQFPLAMDPARTIYIDSQLAPAGVGLPGPVR